MNDLPDLVEIILDKITPKKLKKWFDRQKKPVQYIIGSLYYSLPVIIGVLIIVFIVNADLKLQEKGEEIL